MKGWLVFGSSGLIFFPLFSLPFFLAFKIFSTLVCFFSVGWGVVNKPTLDFLSCYWFWWPFYLIGRVLALWLSSLGLLTSMVVPAQYRNDWLGKLAFHSPWYCSSCDLTFEIDHPSTFAYNFFYTEQYCVHSSFSALETSASETGGKNHHKNGILV